MSESTCSVVLCGSARCTCEFARPDLSDVPMWATWTMWHERKGDGSFVEKVVQVLQVACEECRIWYRAFEGEPRTCPCCVTRAELRALKESR